MSQLVREITGPLSRTCLDHFWCTHPEQLNNVHVLNSGMSDHLPIIATRTYKRARQNRNEHFTITYRDIKSLDKEKFIASLSTAPWDCAFVFEDTNDVVDAWYKIFDGIVKEHLPLKQKRVKRNVQPKWFDRNISRKLKDRDILLDKARRSQSEHDWATYRRAKNEATNLIRRLKKAYFRNKFQENKHDSRKLWNLIKCLLKDDDRKIQDVQRLVEDEVIITDKTDIAETMNSFFVNQQSNLAVSNSSSLEDPILIDSSASQDGRAFNIPHVSKQRIAELLLSIPAHKATGDGGVTAKLLRIAAPAIAGPLSNLINRCIDTQTFPTKWKIVKVTPIFKNQGSREDKANYRPISVLPILSKLLEKHVCEHLNEFLKEHELLHHLQCGFRKFHSTETALIRLMNQLLFDLDKNKVSGLVFIDYKKAFDLIDHSLLLEKLDAYGIRGNDLAFFRDYLSNRTQYVCVNDCRSTLEAVKTGVPQGSILGPVLILLFINDLPSVANQSAVDIYADDTTLSYSLDVDLAPADITSAIQHDLNNISTWSANNKKVVNAAKTKCMLVTGKRLGNKIDDLSLNLRTENEKIEQVASHKLLGITIDQELSQRLGVLRKIRRFLPIEQRKLYYNAMIKQIMLYGSVIWAKCSTDNIKKVFRLQK